MSNLILPVHVAKAVQKKKKEEEKKRKGIRIIKTTRANRLATFSITTQR